MDYIELIVSMLQKLDNRKLKAIYIFIRALMD